MCFSIDSPDSLTNVGEKWYSELRYYCPKTPIVLIGNKKDLRYNEKVIASLKKSNQEPVKTMQAQLMAKQIEAFAYLECSSKTREGVREVFETAARAALLTKNPRSKKRNLLSRKNCNLL